jgi:hypothetical protein
MPSFELHAAKPPGTREERQDAFSGVLGDGRGGTGAWVEHGRYTMACAAAQAVAATSIRMSGGAPVVVTTIGHSLTELRGTEARTSTSIPHRCQKRCRGGSGARGVSRCRERAIVYATDRLLTQQTETRDCEPDGDEETIG